ncbi:MAG TPA: hypothetical protein VLT91_06670 [Rhizomicrobium sp.]|nr:hypothetical protein [Rhizomicrobium sp.]
MSARLKRRGVMLNRIFPRQFDNNFRGHWLAVWLLVPVVLMRLVIGTNSMINTHSVATGADGIPVDSFGAAGSAQVLSLFALQGLYGLTIALLGVLVLLRYRAMIPLYYLLLLILQFGSRALSLLHPTVHAGAATIGAGGITAGALIVYGLLAVTIVGFIASLVGRGYRSPAALT